MEDKSFLTKLVMTPIISFYDYLELREKKLLSIEKQSLNDKILNRLGKSIFYAIGTYSICRGIGINRLGSIAVFGYVVGSGVRDMNNILVDSLI